MDPSTLSPKQFREFSQLINERLGIKMPETKQVMLQSRIQRRAHALDLSGPNEYYQRFFSDLNFQQVEMEELLNLATTNKTDFLREPDHFRYLVRNIVPDHLARNSGAELKIWCAGCSTGEEPYTLAMVLLDERRGRPFEFSIVATDVSTTALRKAIAGIYDEDRLTGVPKAWRLEYMADHEHRVRINADVRRRVSFGHLNFLADRFGVPGPVDVIFFRNVMIYFDRDTQRSVVQKMTPLLRPGGHLFTAHAETLHGLGLPFTQVSVAVYQKNSDTRKTLPGFRREEAVC